MRPGAFSALAATQQNPNWEALIRRQSPLYVRQDEVRNEFERDYTRILHSLAYRRLKHKTQVFYNIENDHICTRMEHVQHVDSVSSTIGKYLGLNVDLIHAIAMAHDLGHAPFGHEGEAVIQKLTRKYLGKNFWHEKNGLYFIDKIELLEDDNRCRRNLNLTYAVRDGVISHCGEVDENGIVPRAELFDLHTFGTSGEYQPATWEGCVVKIADKIAYLGRDIEDAYRLHFMDWEQLLTLKGFAQRYGMKTINTTALMHRFILDICKNSSPQAGIAMSEECRQMLDAIKEFNYQAIYHNKKFVPFQHYVQLILSELFQVCLDAYDGENTLHELRLRNKVYPSLMNEFSSWLAAYCTFDYQGPAFKWAAKIGRKSKNEKIYGRLQNRELYIQAILDYLSGMTDRYAIELFQELIRY